MLILSFLAICALASSVVNAFAVASLATSSATATSSHSQHSESKSSLDATHSLSHVSNNDKVSLVMGEALVHRTSIPLPKVRSPLSKFSFSWAKDLMAIGNRRQLELSDLWTLDEKHQMRSASDTFQRFYDKEQRMPSKLKSLNNKPKGSILHEYWQSPVARSITKMYKKQFIVSGVIKLVNSAVQFLPSLLVSKILKLGAPGTLGGKAEVNRGLMLAMLLFISLSTKTVIENVYFDMVTNLAAQIRGTLSAAIYQKALRLGPEGRQNVTMGEIVNYMQIDTGRLEYVAGSIHTVWDGIFQIVGYTSLLLHFLGPAVFAGIFAMLVIIPFNAYFLQKLSKIREENLKATDYRVKLTNEILQGIRAIKSYNWETPFRERLDRVRAEELQWIKSAANVRAVLIAALSAAPSFVAVFSLAVYASLGNTVDPAKVFTSLALFNQLRFPLTFFPMLLNSLAEGKISVDRLTRFFSIPDVQDYVMKSMPAGEEKMSIFVEKGSFAWSAAILESQSTLRTQNDTAADLSSSSTSESNFLSDANAAINSTLVTNDHIVEARSQLNDINLRVRRGELVAIVGPTGSGKSTLLHALLGELVKCEGNVSVAGRVAYVPQSTWIPNESLQNVILFGRPMIRSKYRQALAVCGLRKDLELMAAGDATEIGERGINLSGGQKQRVSIARAVYEDADVYLFDDPLSALDNEVGFKVFRDCILHALRKKTRILVTHNLNVLPDVDRIVLMDHTNGRNGCRILDQGSLQDLLARGHDLTRFVKAAESSSSSSDLKSGDDALLAASDDNLTLESSSAVSASPSSALLDCAPDCLVESLLDDSHSTSSSEIVHNLIEDNDNLVHASDSKDVAWADEQESTSPLSASGQLITKEDRGEGAVSWPIYRSYFTEAKKPWLLALVTLSFVLANTSQLWQQWIVAAWTSDVGYVKYPLRVYLVGVALMASGVAGFTWLRSYLGIVLGAEASQAIHARMARQVLRAPLSYFESTPVGRLLQRFSKDLDQIDQQLPGSMGQLIASSLNIMSSMFAICLVTPSFAPFLAVIFSIYFAITIYYRPVARELKRLDSLSRSPIFSHFSETLGGLPVLRVFQRQQMFRRANEVKLDDNLSAYFALKIVDRWLSFRLETLGNLVVLSSIVLAVVSGSRAGATGLSLTNALGITGLMNWAVRNAAETESLMNSVERVYYTAQQTPQEAPRVIDQLSPATFATTIPPLLSSTSLEITDDRETLRSNNDEQESTHSLLPRSDAELVTSGWPWQGGVVFEDAVLRYRPDFQPVLRGVTLQIAPGERVGIVGRTGSGKSSLLRGLQRLSELDSGRILVDGVDISHLGVDTVRSSMSIIPQDPVLFSGSIRLNVDPHGHYSDHEIWSALHKAKLGYLVQTLPQTLDYVVSEGGENFSAGQRQLLCLARALVRRSKILLLDEATSSVDYETDSLIQRTIRREFQGATVLTIAHRLDSILDADRVLVLDQGVVQECAPPSELLRRRDSLFAQLVRAEQQQQRQQQQRQVSRSIPSVATKLQSLAKETPVREVHQEDQSAGPNAVSPKTPSLTRAQL